MNFFEAIDNFYKRSYFARISSIILIFLFSFFYCLYYGRIGFNPLDSSIVFDGAWRIISGQHFFVDFYTPNGFTPIVIQAIFFKVFGVSWFSYCLHSAFINGLFCLLVFGVFRLLKVNIVVSLFFCLISGIVFYAPFGTPYIDQHSFFFGVSSIFILLIPFHSKKNFWIHLFFPLLLVLSVLSKQIPALFFLLPAFVIVLKNYKYFKYSFVWLAIGVLISIIFCFSLFYKVILTNVNSFYYYIYELPSAIGKERLENLPYDVIGYIKAILFLCFKVISTTHLYLLYLLLIIPLFVFVISFKNKTSALYHWLLGFCFVLISNAFIILTSNQYENGIGLYGLSLGLLLSAFCKSVFPYLKNKKIATSYIKPTFFVLIIFIVVFDIYGFHKKVIVTRKVHDFPKGIEKYSFVENKSLAFLIWTEPWRNISRNPNELIHFLNKNKGSFFLFGDLSFLNGVLNNNSVSPCLWWHKGLTFPSNEKKEFEEFESLFLRNLKILNPKFIVFDNKNKRTYKNVELSYFPRVNNWIIKNYGNNKVLGEYSILSKN